MFMTFVSRSRGSENSPERYQNLFSESFPPAFFFFKLFVLDEEIWNTYTIADISLFIDLLIYLKKKKKKKINNSPFWTIPRGQWHVTIVRALGWRSRTSSSNESSSLFMKSIGDR